MSVRVGPHVFEDVDYDADFDILYLRTGEPVPVVGEETAEGHVVCFAEADEGVVVGVDLFSPAAELSELGRVLVTLPSGEVAEASGLEAVLGQSRAS
jgi:uncharacterized protein YuzE